MFLRISLVLQKDEHFETFFDALIAVIEKNP